MSDGDQPWRGAATAGLKWDRENSPHSEQFDDVYYSAEDGLEESRHVFLSGNDLPERWQQADGAVFTIAETGFGTGLNFLSTWEQWRRSPTAHKRLHYISIEKYPLSPPQLERALSAWPELSELSSALLGDYPPPLPGRHRLLFDEGRVCLDLVINDVAQALASLQQVPRLRVDSWYLDGFAPARNPDMWTPGLYQAMAALSGPETTFSTFTAAGDVRRGLQAEGFAIEKLAGFGRKREMLRGVYQGTATPIPCESTPWHLAESSKADTRSAIIVGAGLAGCGVAAALAQRGWSVTVLERDTVAGAASGNAQGILYTRTSHRQSDLNDFSLHSYCFALRYYRELLESGRLKAGEDGELCGALHLGPPWDDTSPLADTIASLPGLLAPVDGDQASKLSGLEACPGGLFYPGAGWIQPPALCRTLLMHRNIQLQEGCGDISLQRSGEHWHASGDAGELARASVAIVACGTASQSQQGLEWLPLQSIRGQVTELPSSGALSNLRTVICHSGYLAPARQGLHCIGATFDLDTADGSIRPADHESNLAELQQALPSLTADLAAVDREQLGGRVGFRCASPDYLPVVGPVPERDAFCEDYAGLRKNARRRIPKTGSYLPGLYVSTGHGSRGLTSTPLASEILAAEINGEPWPVDTPLYRALAPARFLVRDLVRNRI